MELGICEYAYLPLRAGMAHKSEMVSQVLFGEIFEILSRRPEWTRIRLLHDDYVGWIETCTVSEYKGEATTQAYVNDCFVVNEDITALIKNEKFQLIIPRGALLPKSALETKTFSINENNYYILNDLNQIDRTDLRKCVKRCAESLLETPYLWGGRSQWGIDCSGFAQLVYRYAGMLLPRDASQQAMLGSTLNFIEEARPGDLAFFDNDEGNIVHVGIFYSPTEIIHASKKVRIDRIDHHGIYNDDFKKYTHKLRVLKNVIG